MRSRVKKVARTVASAALTVALAIGCIAPSIALGDVGTDTGTITITASAGNDGVTYHAYKLFTCDVELKSGSLNKYAATNIEWASDNMGTAITRAISTYDRTYTSTAAQDAADYLANSIKGTDSSTRVGANGLAENLTKAIIEVDTPAPAELTAGTQSEPLPEGYYLIVTNPSSLSGARMGTAPIFTMLGNGQDLQITEKTSVPTLYKTVTEDSAPGEQRSYADAHTGQDVTFTLTSTMPDSINTFTKYFCKIDDELPAGMDLTCSSGSFAESDVTVQIALGDTPTIHEVSPSSFEASYASRKLTVEFADLKNAVDTTGAAIAIDATAKVQVIYKASLNADAVVGAPGNTNTATFVYTNNPQDVDTTSSSASKQASLTYTNHPLKSSSTTTSTAVQATVYEYQLKLYKYDKEDLEAGTKTPLPDATFTIQATGADDSASTNKYVQADGSLGTSAHEFVTSDTGLITVQGLDAGTYTISETSAPSDYVTITDDLTLTITPSFWAADDDGLGSNAVGSLKSVSATLSGGNGDSAYTKVDSSLTDNGVITIQVSNSKTQAPPFTGLLPALNESDITLIAITGAAILAVCLAAIALRRRNIRN